MNLLHDKILILGKRNYLFRSSSNQYFEILLFIESCNFYDVNSIQFQEIVSYPRNFKDLWSNYTVASSVS